VQFDIDLARQQIFNQTRVDTLIELIERDTVPAGDILYDGAIIGWGAYMLIQGSKRRISFLEKLHKQLEEGSPLLVSFFARAESDKIFIAANKIANLFRLVLRREPTDVGHYLQPNYCHWFVKDQIQAEFSKAGLETVFFSKKPYGHAVGISK